MGVYGWLYFNDDFRCCIGMSKKVLKADYICVPSKVVGFVKPATFEGEV